MTDETDNPKKLLDDINRLQDQIPKWDPTQCTGYCAKVREIAREIPKLQQRDYLLTKQGYYRHEPQLMVDLREGIDELSYSCDAGFALCEPGDPVMEEINRMIIAKLDRFDAEIDVEKLELA